MVELVALQTVEAAAVEHLLDRAFGPDRHTRTAYRLRAGTSVIPRFSFAAIDTGRLVGSIQCWPVLFSGDDDTRAPLVLVGPVAVAPDRQGDGIGRALMQAGLAKAGDAALMLIGDPDYYGRFFGFSATRTGSWRLPGPVERHRLLARGVGVPEGPGVVGPRLVVPA